MFHVTFDVLEPYCVGPKFHLSPVNGSHTSLIRLERLYKILLWGQ